MGVFTNKFAPSLPQIKQPAHDQGIKNNTVLASLVNECKTYLSDELKGDELKAARS
ncbi:hypothetical protein TUM4433_22770 [Shewanella schlegeliana]|nr:hypothetical protein TUM4433_22770 [Shewanella schlegeliana]